MAATNPRTQGAREVFGAVALGDGDTLSEIVDKPPDEDSKALSVRVVGEVDRFNSLVLTLEQLVSEMKLTNYQLALLTGADLSASDIRA